MSLGLPVQTAPLHWKPHYLPVWCMQPKNAPRPDCHVRAGLSQLRRNFLLENVRMSLLMFSDWDDTALLAMTHLPIRLAGCSASRCLSCQENSCSHLSPLSLRLYLWLGPIWERLPLVKRCYVFVIICCKLICLTVARQRSAWGSEQTQNQKYGPCSRSCKLQLHSARWFTAYPLHFSFIWCSLKMKIAGKQNQTKSSPLQCGAWELLKCFILF